VAWLTLDNLTGEPALDWLRQAVPTMAASQIAGLDRWHPFRADTTGDAVLGGAQTAVHGFYERRAGKLRFTFAIEDLTTHRMRTVTAEDGALDAAMAAARAVEPKARDFGSSNPAAIEAWGRQDFAAAVAADPDFGLAWRDWIQQQATSAPAEAAALARRALARPNLRSPLDRAQIQLLAAGLSGDRAAEVRAGRELLRLVPNDTALARQVAELATRSRLHADAAAIYEALTRLEPEEASHWNQLGYARFFAGDLRAARTALEHYTAMPGQAANGLDSQGEILFMAGQFGEAEQLFLKSHAANPEFLGGAGLLKAAYARWLAGDLPGADGLFEQYVKFRLENKDNMIEWRRASWEYATGRREAAIARLRRASGAAAQLAASQLMVWEKAEALAGDLSALERAYQQAVPPADGLARTLYARALLRAGRRAEAVALVEPWPLPESGDPLLQSLLYPWYRELRQQSGK
jgi:hypothetical protein